jgi:hypothetical protein
MLTQFGRYSLDKCNSICILEQNAMYLMYLDSIMFAPIDILDKSIWGVIYVQS